MNTFNIFDFLWGAKDINLGFEYYFNKESRYLYKNENVKFYQFGYLYHICNMV